MFGRKKAADEDPFAALKQDGTYQSQPTTTVEGIPGSGLEDEPTVVANAAPIPVAPPVAPPTPTSAPTPTSTTPPPAFGSSQATRRPSRASVRSYRGKRSGGGRSSRVTSLIVLGVFAAIVIPVISNATHAVHSFSVPAFTVPNFTTPSVTLPAVPKAPKPPRATNYLRPGGLRLGLRRIARRFPGARVTNLRVDDNSLDAFVYPRTGGVKDLHLSAAGTFVVSSPSPGEKPIAIAAIPLAAVPRIVAAMGSQFHIPASRIDYIVLSTSPGLPPEWIAFAKNKAHTGYAASLDGTGLHRIG
jgi:hypothetical protein